MQAPSHPYFTVAEKHSPDRLARIPYAGFAFYKLLLAVVVFLGIGIAAWGMLRAEFVETFSNFRGCQTVALEGPAIQPGGQP